MQSRCTQGLCARARLPTPPLVTICVKTNASNDRSHVPNAHAHITLACLRTRARPHHLRVLLTSGPRLLTPPPFNNTRAERVG